MDSSTEGNTHSFEGNERSHKGSASIPDAILMQTGLFVDDDALNREMAEDIIQECAAEYCRIITAKGEHEAIALLESSSTSFDFVITDLEMEGGDSGLNVALVAQRRGIIRIVINTGSCDAIHKGNIEGFPVVQKMRMNELISFVKGDINLKGE